MCIRDSVYATSQPLYVSVDSLSSNVRGSLWVSNNKSLTLLDNSATSSAQVNVCLLYTSVNRAATASR